MAPSGRIKAMDGVNPDTVWTWNAIGKRAGRLEPQRRRARSREGFLLNHLIIRNLPHEGGVRSPSNSDPVTGQAAWFDLRVASRNARTPSGACEPQFPALPLPPGWTRRRASTITAASSARARLSATR